MSTPAASLKTGTALRILVADDHDLIRRGLKTMLESHPGWSVCAEANTGPEAVTKTAGLKPDVAIVDIAMPELNGIEAARRMRKVSPNTEILFLSMHHTDQLVRDILDAGFRGYIIKSDSDRDLVLAVETLAKHEPFFTPEAMELILSNLDRKGGWRELPEDNKERLSSRERQILQLIAEGKSNKELASILSISLKTAETHRASIMRKLKAHSASELVRYALRNKIIEP